MDNATGPTIGDAMTPGNDIIIGGGGLNGLVLALALAGEGFDVTLVDALPRAVRQDPEFDGRSYALALASQRLMGALGIWQGIADHAQPILRIRTSDGRAGEGPGPFVLAFDHAEIEEGPMGYMVEDRHLRSALLDAAAREPAISHRDGSSIVAQAVTPGGVTVRLDTGETLEGRLLVGCDGRNSQIAARAGIGRTGWDYRQTAIVCAVEHARPHEGTAHQFFMPGGPLAILPLKGNRSSIVWSERRDRAEALLAMTDADFLAALKPAFGSFLGPITLAGERWGYPLGLSLANAMTAERVALAGDAAHGVHPIAGQGLNAGLRDVAALSDVLGEARRRGEDPGSAGVLDRYARWRRFDTALLGFGTDAFNRLFSNDNPALRLVRDLGMGAVSRLPALRRGLIREAAGLTGDLPRLMRG